MKTRILIAVLNWGLGHATRSIPLIRELQKVGFEPVLASDGDALLLLQKEFPELTSYPLPSYSISYPRNGDLFKVHFLLKGPQLLRSILAENRSIRKIISSENIKGIISDNRLGAFSSETPCVYITHQLKVLSGRTTFLSSRIHKYFINRFQECWVPDTAEAANLSGKMSHGIKLQIPVRYLGILSRFQKRKQPKKYDLLVLLSGPEPQRSLLQGILLKELNEFPGSILFVSGSLEQDALSMEKESWEFRNFLSGEALETALNASRMVLCRSGYSSILDLAVLQKKAFLIPTPGQYEQEYLAAQMQHLKIAPYCQQKDFSLEKLSKVNSYSGFKDFGHSKLAKGLFSIFEK